MFPNPADDKVFIETETNGLLNTEISDVSGRILKRENFYGADVKKIDISDFSAGVYFLRITDEEKNAGVIKVIKE